VAVVWIVILCVVLLVAFLATLFGLPGTFLVVAAATVYDACHGWQPIPGWQLLAMLVLAALSEVADQILSAWGVRRYEGTSRGGMGAWLGGVLGGIAGASVAPPIGALGGPVGIAAAFVLGPLLGGMAGGFGGAVLLELTHKDPKRTFGEALRSGWGAFLGRMLGVLLKVALCAGMIALVVYDVLTHR
jgi:uncharacterized protein